MEKGVIFGRKVHTINESVFGAITEESSYWIGFLMADGSVFKEKTGNPRIALTLAKYDHEHLVKFTKFLNCSYKILRKKTKAKGKIIIQYTLRFSSKHIAEVITKFGVVARKSLIAKVIGLENNRHFWRGVVDGDGYINNRNGQDGDKIILTGSYDLLKQFAKADNKHISILFQTLPISRSPFRT
jgi:DNA-binding transcriptional regulator WhiA